MQTLWQVVSYGVLRNRHNKPVIFYLGDMSDFGLARTSAKIPCGRTPGMPLVVVRSYGRPGLLDGYKGYVRNALIVCSIRRRKCGFSHKFCAQCENEITQVFRN